MEGRWEVERHLGRHIPHWLAVLGELERSLETQKERSPAETHQREIAPKRREIVHARGACLQYRLFSL